MSRASVSSAAVPTYSSFRRFSLKPSYSISNARTCSTASTAATSTTRILSGHVIPHPSVEVIGGARDVILPALKSLHNNTYRPYPIIGWNRHAETIYAAFFRTLPDVKLRRECLRTRDDGSVALDWVSGDDSLPPDCPVLILLPGLTGGSEDSYVRHMLVRAKNKGWRVVVFNSRGCGNSPVTTPQFYSASFLGDIHEVVAHVGNCYPTANLYAVGWSLGANILVRYLGQAANDPIAPSRGIPHKDIEENPNCLLIVTPQGGHLGWLAGSEAPNGAPWTDPIVMDFLQHLEQAKSTTHLESVNDSIVNL
ncbi:unnamed protein product [Cuscuta europaea]|uniref:AB hydrolase-1 domain-containing protein n=1 Tax=Cuscuta europaea TaxID=41803 RepID=A0A9P0YMV1_CUSEU|nr:unnamed protein product [Cuscuta europaea]